MSPCKALSEMEQIMMNDYDENDEISGNSREIQDAVHGLITVRTKSISIAHKINFFLM